MQDKTLLILNGPALADLRSGGDRNGNITLGRIRDECSALCDELGMSLDFRHADDEDEMLGWIAKDSEACDALIINPAGCVKVHADRSAIETIAHLNKPVIEVHLTNILREGAEPIKPLQNPEGEMGFICGFGIHGYLLGIKAVAQRLQGSSP